MVVYLTYGLRKNSKIRREGESMEYTVDTKAIKKLMIDNNINSIGELSERSGVNRNTTADVVSGKIRPSTAVMEKFMVALNIEPVNAGPIFFVPTLRNT